MTPTRSRWFFVSSVLFLLVAVSVSAQDSTEEDFERLQREAVDLAATGDVSGAIAVYEQLREIAPEEQEFVYNHGTLLVEAGAYGEAAETLQYAIDHGYDAGAAYYNLGLAFLGLERIEDAITAFDGAIERSPADVDALINRGIAYRLTGDDERATEDFIAASEIAPQRTEPLVHLGTILYDGGQYEQAIALYDEALDIDPQLVDAWYNRGNAAYFAEDFDRAFVSYQHALDLAPEDEDILFNLGLAAIGRSTGTRPQVMVEER